MKHVISIILFAIIITSVFGENVIALRMDDYGLNNYEFNKKLFELHEKYNIPISVGVIPFNENGKGSLDARETTLLIEYVKKGIADVNLHGYNHKNNLPEKFEGESEFYSMPKEIQLLWINRGKRYLETILGIEITGFIPPFNTYDNNTLYVLDSLDFNYISSACYGLIPKKELNENIKHIPYTCLLKDFEKVNLSENENSYYIVLFHESDFTGKKQIGFDRYEKMLMRKANYVSLNTLAKMETFTVDRYLNNIYNNKMLITKPVWGLRTLKRYYKIDESNSFDLSLYIISYFVLYFMSFFIGIISTVFMFKKHNKVIKICCFLFLLLVSYLFIFDIYLSFKYWICFFYALGVTLTLFIRGINAN